MERYDKKPEKTIEEYIRDIEAQQQEIDRLIKARIEQAGRLMQLEAGLKKLRSSFQWLSESIRDLDYKAWAKNQIDAIDALINPVCNTTKLECCRCNPGDCEHRMEPRREKQE